MTPLRARYARIERLVGHLLSEHGIVDAPVPIDRIVKKTGIDLRYGKLDDVSGLLVREAKGITIGVNSEHPFVRQRFTIAHEFGHYLLHEGISAHYDRDYKVESRVRVNFRSRESAQATNVEEIEANFFAASILMPKQFLDKDNALETLDSDTEVRKLASRYRVSGHAMSLRLANVYGDYRPF